MKLFRPQCGQCFFVFAGLTTLLQLFERGFKNDGPAFHGEMGLSAGKQIRLACLFQSDVSNGIGPQSRRHRGQWKHVDADIPSSFANQRPAIADGNGNGASMLAWLNKDRQLDLPSRSFQPHDLALAQAESVRESRGDSGVVPPGDFADGIWKLLQPGIIRMTSVTQRHTFVEMELVTIVIASGLFLSLQDGLRGLRPIALETR